MINCNSQIIWSIENIKIILTLRLSFNIFFKNVETILDFEINQNEAKQFLNSLNI